MGLLRGEVLGQVMLIVTTGFAFLNSTLRRGRRSAPVF